MSHFLHFASSSPQKAFDRGCNLPTFFEQPILARKHDKNDLKSALD
jgi:hypothetical protein